jgi:predicted kinase
MWLLLMCGPAFSGKTTLSRRLAVTFGWDLVNYDQLLSALGLKQNDMSLQNWKTLHEQAALSALESLTNGRRVIVDDTFPRRALRNRFDATAKQCGAHFLIIEMISCRATLRQRVDRNLTEQTRRHVPWEQIELDLSEFEPPAFDEPSFKVQAGDETCKTIERLRAVMRAVRE